MAQLSTKSRPADYSAGLSRPSIVLFNNQQWAYLQRRFQITPRELEIAKLLCQGYSNEEIADSLNIKEGTVKVHVRNIYRKTWVQNKILMLLRFIEDSNRFF
ncbi:MAG: helix-turn-helix transcriptional regulator [Planctomycetes bacterium]|nr:helix-turn-helix transcriptional regulator [Planctomycetota bacterium]